MTIRRLLVFPLLMLASVAATGAPWSTSKPHTSDNVRIEFLGHSYGRILVAAPSVSGEYRAEIERATAVRIGRSSDQRASAVSYMGAFGAQSDPPVQEIEKKIGDAGIDGVVVIDLHGELKSEWDTTQKLNIERLGTTSVSPAYKDVPLRQRDRAKRKIHARVVLFDYASKKIAWEADVRIDVVSDRADGIHVADYIGKQIGRNLGFRGLLGPKQ